MKHTTTSLLCALVLAGCSHDNARYIDPNDGSGVVSIDKVNVQDFVLAADAMLQSLYASPAFTGIKARDGGSPILLVGRVRNDTTDNFDTDMLIKKMTVSVTRSGKARVATASTVIAPQDQAAAEARRVAAAANGTTAAPLIPDYTLSGKILETKASAGKTKQATYTFQLTLTEVKTGLAVWEEEKAVTKQGERSKVGF